MSLSKDLSFLELFILNTIVYFDLFDYPLTATEIYNYLYTGGMTGAKVSVLEIEEYLQHNSKLQKIIAFSGGFYFLSGREEIIKTRLERYSLADQKLKIIWRFLRPAKYVPFVKMIGVCNNLAYRNARPASDLDLFVVTAPQRIWLTRLLLIFVITILGLRPPKTKAPDKICLSFYTTTDNLDLTPIKILQDDIYLTYWLSALMPVYDRAGVYDKLIKANGWLLKYLPNWQPKIMGFRYRVEDNKFSTAVVAIKETVLNIFGQQLEAWAHKWQLAKMSVLKKDVAEREKNWVVLSDQMIKLHENDRRSEYLDKFEQRLKEVIEKI